MNLKELQNGSDIRGIALDMYGKKVNLTSDITQKIGFAFSNWLKNRISSGNRKLTVGIGRDPRISGQVLKNALIQGIIADGNNVEDYDLATTPAMFMSTQFNETNCDAAIMITASHLPPDRNGLKFFTREGGLEKQDIKEILNLAETINYNSIKTEEPGKINSSDIIERYSKYLCDTIRLKTGMTMPLEGMHIILDAGNGSGGFFADKILKVLGADITGSQFLNPDGYFPNHTPNPEDNDAIKSICNKVLTTKADLGIIFDTDVDRAAIVDKEGKPVNRNRLIALLAHIVLEEHPNSFIVTDSITSEGLEKFIKARGGSHHRFKRGYRNVINEGIKLNNEGKECWLSVETSGHGAMKENYFLDDGAYLIAKILIKAAMLKFEGENLSELINDLQEPIESKEIRINITTPDYKKFGESIINDLKYFVKKQSGWEPAKVNYEGIRIKCDLENGNGWFLLRLSLHDPVLPLNIESDSKGGVNKIFSVLNTFLKKYNYLEIPAQI